MKKLSAILMISLISACGMIDAGENVDAKNYPVDSEQARKNNAGKLSGEEGINLFGKGKSNDDNSSGGIGVNSFLWRATLDTIGFMPIVTADPFGGVITTDWYEDPAAPGERFKINALILDSKLRSDGIKITLFKQILEKPPEPVQTSKKRKKIPAPPATISTWRDVVVAADTARQMEEKVLTRARELRVKQLGR